MAKDAAKGLNWLHGITRLVHNDVKSANFLVWRERGERRRGEEGRRKEEERKGRNMAKDAGKGLN
jgi:hypothetical protein